MAGGTDSSPKAAADLLKQPEVVRARARFVAGLLATALGALVGAIAFGRSLVGSAPVESMSLVLSVVALAASLAVFVHASLYSSRPVPGNSTAKPSDAYDILDHLRELIRWGQWLALSAVVLLLFSLVAGAVVGARAVHVLVEPQLNGIDGLSQCESSGFTGYTTYAALSAMSTPIEVALDSPWCNLVAGDVVFVDLAQVVVPSAVDRAP